MNASPCNLPRGARIWMTCGRLLSPFSAGLLLSVGVLFRSQGLRRAAGDVLIGRCTLVGPKVTRNLHSGGSVPAGVFSESALSERMNLETEPGTDDPDLVYLQHIGPRRDFSILLRSLWSLVLDRGGPATEQPGDHFNLFGIIVNNSETNRVLSTIQQMTQGRSKLLSGDSGNASDQAEIPAQVFFVNANNLNLAVEQPGYMEVLRKADLVLPDGIGVKLGLQMAGGRLRKNLNGTDLIPHLAGLFVDEDWPVYLLGAAPDVLRKARRNLESRHPGLRIVGTHDGYFQENEEALLCEEINSSGAMALIIGMGTPRQELWTARNAGRLRVPLVLAMGGLLDFLGEKNRRAPLWMRQAGLEWVFRMLQEPGRMWRRYIIGNPVFLWRVRRWIRSRPRNIAKGKRQ